MCNFLSAIVMKNGDLITNPQFTDSHEDLLAANNIRDGLAQQGTFARIEFTPPEDLSTIQDLATWNLKVGEKVEPDWFDAPAVRAKLEDRVRRMFIDDEREFLLGGVYILLDGAKIKKVKNSRIVMMLGSSQVGAMRGSSMVRVMGDSSMVRVMRSSSQVGEMSGSSQVGEMLDSSQVGEMYHNSQVGKMWDSSMVRVMRDSSLVKKLYDRARLPEGKEPLEG